MTTRKPWQIAAELRKALLERDRDVCRRFKAGEAKAALAREYRVSRQTIYDILERNGVYPESSEGSNSRG